jgi:glutathione S-transferase
VITLYGSRASPFTEKVARGLALKKLDFALREPESAEDYRRWSPTGRLPALDLDGERLHDSTQILLRVNERYPDPPLLSPDRRAAESQVRLARWIDESFFWYWNRWRRRGGAPAEVGPFLAFAGESLAEAERRMRESEPPRPAGVSLRSWVARREPASQDLGEQERLVREIAHRVDDLARMLAPRPFFYGDQIGIADLAAHSMLRVLALDTIPGTRRHLEGHPPLVELMQRVERATSAPQPG